jgi:hypothetical protein
MKLHGYEAIRDLMGDPELQKRLAKYMALAVLPQLLAGRAA